ncbi:unnamed protein product [Rhizophagus irregularis]|nr:unnamed protein product [Rhizophagus irregularis]CAB5108917.1 unnamed protein product [Rhizophagus irregularis]
MSDENGQTTSSISQHTSQNGSKNKITRQDKVKIILRVVLMLFLQIFLPFILYYTLNNYIPEIWALLISGIPPLAMAIYGLISKRRVDIIGILIIISFLSSAIASVINNDPKIQLLRKSVVSSIISLAFIISLIPIKIGTFKMRPFAFHLLKEMATGGTLGYSSSKVNLRGLTEDEPIDVRWDRYWASYQYFRCGFTIMTAIWGFGLLSTVPIRIIIVFKVSSVEKSFLYINVLQYIWMFMIAILTLICAWWMKRQGDKIAIDSNSDKPLE